MRKRHWISLVVGALVIVSMLVVAGAGWFTTQRELEAHRTLNENLKAEKEQYALLLSEANERTMVANKEVMTLSERILSDTTMIGELELKLSEAESYGSHWWEIAHPREFKSIGELKTWLAEDDTDRAGYIPSTCEVGGYDCDDYAVAMMTNALGDGYLVSVQLDSRHMINSTLIGNEIYFIEPQTDEVWLWGYRD